MTDYYRNGEKKEYAKLAAGVREENDPIILSYEGRNPLLLLFRKLRKIQKEKKIISDNKIYIANLAVITDFSCNLNCRGCGQHTPEIKLMDDFLKIVDIDQAFRDIDKISQVVDGIGGIALANGEGFMNKYIENAMDYYSTNPKILKMNIPTNGSIVPKQGIIEKMAKYGVTATITKYRVVSDAKRKKIQNLFNVNHIKYATFMNRKWTYLEYLPKYKCTNYEAEKKYRNCEHFFMLLQGNLWKCETDATRVMCGLRDEKENDCICVKNATYDELRSFIVDKSSLPYLESCYHCRGRVGSMAIEIPAGEQITVRE